MPRKAKPVVRRKRAVRGMKHVRMRAGQKLTVHVLGARGKEVSCQIVEANADGQVQFAPMPQAGDGQAGVSATV